MLQEAAYKYVMLSEDTLKAIGYALLLLGAAIAGYFHTSSTLVRRGKYFAGIGLIFFLVSLAQVVWLSAPAAIAGGYLWIFLYADILSSMAGGYAIVVLAKARSRDAFGNPGKAFLALIPFANLWLFFAPSMVSEGQKRGTSIWRGLAAVVVGLVLFALSLICTVAINNRANEVAEQSSSDEKVQSASLDLIARTQGIESALKDMTSQTPQKIDDVTTLLRIEADRNVLQYVYELSSSANEIPYSFGGQLIGKNCKNNTVIPLLRNGATVKHLYLKPDGTEIGTVIVTRQICGL
jgi:hypothetical protein